MNGCTSTRPISSFEAKPANDAVRARLLQPDAHRFGLTLAQIARLHDREQAAPRDPRAMRRLIDHRHARPLELAHELRILRHRRQQHDLQRRIRLEQAIEQRRPSAACCRRWCRAAPTRRRCVRGSLIVYPPEGGHHLRPAGAMHELERHGHETVLLVRQAVDAGALAGNRKSRPRSDDVVRRQLDTRR